MKSNDLNLSFLLFFLLVLCSCKDQETAQRATLPVYELRSATIPSETLRRISESLFNVKGEFRTLDDRQVLERENRVVEYNTKTGGIWFADRTQLWNPELTPTIIDSTRALELSNNMLTQYNLLPERNRFTITEFVNYSNTRAAIFNTEQNSRQEKVLDMQVNYNTKLLPDSSLNLPGYPIVGGGGEINLTFGNEGTLINYSAAIREVVKIDSLYPLISQEEADSQFKSMTNNLSNVEFSSFIAYYSAPSHIEQKFLYPVYVYSGTFERDNNRIPMRLVMIPASTFNWEEIQNWKYEPISRDSTLGPPRRSTLPEGTQEKGTSENIKTPLYGFSDNPSPKTNMILSQSSSWKECGTSWIGLSQGLSGSSNNAKGFRDGLSSAGWNINFNWGDAAAWESDWKNNDDSYVDAADFVFYTGHAWLDGWVLNPPNGNDLTSNEEGVNPESPGDLWGQQDLEWFVIAACGPLQDNAIVSSGGDVFNRWKGSFDRLHLMLGYGAVTFDNEEEGERLTQYCKDGNTIIDAWFRTAREIQPTTNGYSAPDGPTIWVGVVYGYRSGSTSPYNDHIWEEGSVASDPVLPNVFVAMWTTT